MSEIVIPYCPRKQFTAMHERRQRWGVVVAHVRAGKTVACVNELIRGALTCQKPNPRFAYIAPFFSQAKDVAWAYLRHYTSVIPGATMNESELRVDLPNGGRVRLYGADNYERLAGIYLDGVVLDEYGDMDPRAWKEVLRARLSDREGWALFIGTPKGPNHFAELWDAAPRNPEWFTLRLPASETGLLPLAELESARSQMSEEDYAAQYECSFEASIVGSYFGKQMAEAKSAGRISRVPYQPELGVHTWWDLGIDDAMAIWFTQDVGREVHVIDYLENSGEGLPWYARQLQEKGYVYASHNAPHDIQVRELGSGKSRLETARSLGIRFAVVPDIDRQDGIDAARAFLSRCWFDEERTERGRLALASYHKTWDEKRKTFQAQPYHDWSSNAADAFRYLAVGHKTATPKRHESHRPAPLQLGAESQAWMGT